MGHATEQGTARYESRKVEEGLPSHAFRKLGRTQWEVSTLGFGCYRIDSETPEYQKALVSALRHGCNLIDTSTNYGDGSSETCVGMALEEVIQNGSLRRDEVVVISKVGYVQGGNLDLVMNRENQGNPYPDVVKYNEGCWHCIHPQFISDQLDLSLSRLRQDRVDVYLLHNPEYFFSDAKRKGGRTDLEALRTEFYRRVEAAFDHLESEADKGRIGYYGVSSNTFGQEADEFDTTSLARMWQIAQRVAIRRYGDEHKHRFAVVQLPLNLFESGPVLTPNNGIDLKDTVVEYAKGKDLAVLVNRPLNAIVGNQLLRLTDFKHPENERSVADCLKDVEKLEANFVTQFASQIPTEEGSVPATEFFRVARELSNPDIAAIPLEQWSTIESQMILPQVRYIVNQLNKYFAELLASPWTAWRDSYLPRVEELLGVIRSDCAKRSQKVSDAVTSRLDLNLPEAIRKEPLSRKALAVLINTTGISSVLNGMRREAYVKDSLGTLMLEPFPVEKRLYETFRISNA